MSFDSKPRTTPAGIAGSIAALLVFLALAGMVIVQLVRDTGRVEHARALNLEAFDQAWLLVRDRHFDPTLGGIDWPAVRDELRPRMAETHNRREGREVLRQMLERLGQSHFALIPAEALDARTFEREAGSTGLDLRLIDGSAIITAVDDGSPAAEAGIAPGWRLTAVDGRRIDEMLAELAEQLPPGSRRQLQMTDGVRRLLRGTTGVPRRLVLADSEDRERPVLLSLDSPPGRLLQAGTLPAVFSRIEVETLDRNIGYVAFEAFANPTHVMATFNDGLERFLEARGLIIDLRGNGGGMLEMVTGMLGWLVTERRSIGSMVMRDESLEVLVLPRRRSFAGPVAILIDEVCLSGAEVFAHGARSLGRGYLIGARTSGSVLGGRIKRLPTDDALMFAFSDMRTVDGETLEGVGVEPDLAVRPTREQLLRDEDPALEAAIEWIRTQPPVAEPGVRRPLAPRPAPDRPAEPVIDPAAAEVLDAYLGATGGAEAYRRLETRILRMRLELEGEGGIPLEITTFQARPNRSLTRIESEYLGAAEIGTDGRRAWHSDLFSGSRLLDAEERAQLVRQNLIDAPARWLQGLRRVEYLGVEEVDGRLCHRVRLEPRLGAVEEHWYDRQTALLTRLRVSLDLPMGRVTAEHYPSDYQESDGILMPRLLRTELLGQTRLGRIESVEHNAPLSDDLFELPAPLEAEAGGAELSPR